MRGKTTATHVNANKQILEEETKCSCTVVAWRMQDASCRDERLKSLRKLVISHDYYDEA